MRRPRLLLLAALAASLLAVPSVLAEDGEVLADRWDEVRIGGERVGHAHTLVRRVPHADGARVETTVRQSLALSRLGQALEIEGTTTTVEREDGSLVSLREVKQQSAVETVVEIAFDAEGATVATTTMDSTRKARIPIPAGTVGPWAAERIGREHGLAPGTSFEVRTYETDLGPVKVKTTVREPEEVEDADGQTVRLVRLDSEMDKMPIVITSWVTAEREGVRTRTDIAGMRIETLRTTRERALGEGASPKPPAEIFVSTLIRTRDLVPHARTLDSAVLVLRPQDAAKGLPDLADDRQKIVSRAEDGSLVVEVARREPSAGRTGTRPLADPPAELARYLAPTSMLQADDPLVVAASREAVGAETDAWRAAQAIERWVHDAIEKKGMGLGFASALEVCRDREGDCTEHAVLVAALCRAAGIPSRVAMGLVYLTGVFGGHAWNEVWIDGDWYGLDATLGLGYLDPLHITLGRLAMEEGTYGAEFAGLVGSLGGFGVQVREVRRGGETVRLHDPAAVTTTESRFVHRPWGLALDAPQGFSIERRAEDAGLDPTLVTLKAAGEGDAKRTITVIAENLAPGDDLARHARRAPEEAKIDGRPAKVGTVGQGAAGTRVAFVIDDADSLFVFTLTPYGPADAPLWTAFLDSIDLDAER